MRTLQSYTSRNLIVTNWQDGLGDAYMLMRAHGVRHLPVVDDDGGVVGIISDRDFMRALQIEQADFASGYVPRPEFDANYVVRDFMSWPVAAVDEERPVADAAKLMIDQKISALIVTRKEDEVVGIVTTEDMLRALLDLLEPTSDRVRHSVEEFVYRSPVGRIATALANAGI